MFALFIVLLIVPQTRTPIQVALSKIRVFIWSPSAISEENQTQLEPFTYKLADLEGLPTVFEIGQGKTTFIGYWATWCPPCIAELPSIEQLFTDYGDKINFILITNEETQVVNNFLEGRNINLPVFNPRMQAPKALFDRSIPTNYIIDAQGKIIIKETGAADWNSQKVRDILKGLLKDNSIP